jgi:ABC-type glutathione transport system ATPase component
MRECSTGQQQRAPIVRVLAAWPRALLADESVSMVDVLIRLEVIAELGVDLDRVALGITSDIALACYFADEILVMHSGRIGARGGAEWLTRRPTHPYTQRLIASTPGSEASRRRVAARLGSDACRDRRRQKDGTEELTSRRRAVAPVRRGARSWRAVANATASPGCALPRLQQRPCAQQNRDAGLPRIANPVLIERCSLHAAIDP